MLDSQLQAYYTWYKCNVENNWQYGIAIIHTTCLLHAPPTRMYNIYTLPHTVRIVESAEAAQDPTADYTGQIRQFSEIGVGGPITNTPRPWVCYTDFNLVNNPIAVVQWQTPSGSVVPSGSNQATGSQFFSIAINQGLALLRGPDYNSPDGEYCCEIPSVSGQRRCVTLSECVLVLVVESKLNNLSYPPSYLPHAALPY